MRGIDREIQRANEVLEGMFSTGGIFDGRSFNLYGRAYIESVNRGVRPYIYQGGKKFDYKEVLQNDKSDYSSFWRLTNPQNMTSFDVTTDIEYFILCNLNKLYPSIDYRADEDLILDVLDILTLTPFDIRETNTVVRGFDAISEFENDNNGRQTKHPYFVAKLGLSINYSNC